MLFYAFQVSKSLSLSRHFRSRARRKHSKYQPVIIRETFIAKRRGSVLCDRPTENRHALRSRRVHSSQGESPPLHPVFTPMPASLVETIFSSRSTRKAGARRSPSPLLNDAIFVELVQYSKHFEFPPVSFCCKLRPLRMFVGVLFHISVNCFLSYFRRVLVYCLWTSAFSKLT